MVLLTILSSVCAFAFFGELVYSFYKKDKVYSLRGTVGNVINFIALSLISQKAVPIYFGYFFAWYVLRGHASLQVTTISVLLAFICVDFMYYVFHRVIHSVALFWRFHRVHHSDSHFNLATSFRVSVVEHLGILLFFVPVLLLGFNPQSVFIAIYFLGLYQFLCHSQYVRLPKIVSYVLVTPQTHRTHHDQIIAHQNSNFGGVLSVWDRLFGTFKGEADNHIFGIKGYKEDNPLKFQMDSFSKKV